LGHIVRRTPWCTIDINTTTGQIFLQEKWQYSWIVQAGAGLAAWTYNEMHDFHAEVDRLIWKTWSNHVRFNIHGTTPFAKQFKTKGLPINIDVRWVTGSPHWEVEVQKIPSSAKVTSSILWTSRKVFLDTNDINDHPHGVGVGATVQIPVVHEFGHTLGNTVVLSRGDEYHAGHTHVLDTSSVMNAGLELRDRHFLSIIDELDQMIPKCTFSIQKIST